VAKKQLSDAFKKNPGALHKQLGVAKGKPIGKGRLRAAAKSGSKLERERAQAALNMEAARKGAPGLVRK